MQPDTKFTAEDTEERRERFGPPDNLYLLFVSVISVNSVVKNLQDVRRDLWRAERIRELTPPARLIELHLSRRDLLSAIISSA